MLAVCGFGIGGLVAFVYGWMKHREWGITNIMYAWTGCIAVAVLGNIIYLSTAQVVVVRG